jgi:hypothetical protein
VTVPATRLVRWTDGFAERHGGSQTLVVPSGLVLRGEDGERAEIGLPYLPWDGAGVADAVAHLTGPRRTLVLAVRRAGYTCAVVEPGPGDRDAVTPGGHLAVAKSGRRHVHGRSAAGGWSQKRYARRRDNQAAELVESIARTAQDLFADSLTRSGPPTWLATGGDRSLVDAVLADSRMDRVARLPRAVHLAVADPGRAWAAELPDLLSRATITLYPGDGPE